jgi:UDP-2-acetamido-2-deoxy-ribo-hexuluronate aminotransferase
MKVPMVDLAARHRRVADDAERRVIEVLRSGWYIGGPVVAGAEAALAARFDYTLGVGVGSGTEALILALKALGIGPGARVLVPALSFFATAEAVLYVGAEPVFGDVLADRPLLDVSAAPTDVDAAILVHLFGARSEAPAIDGPIIDDIAQAAGWGHGRPPGVVGCLSLYPTKTLHGAGDAGGVFTDDPELAERVRRLGRHGQTSNYTHDRVMGALGTSSRLDAVQAALTLAHLADLDRRVAARQATADRYDAALGHLNPLPREPGDAVHHYILRPDDRAGVQAKLAEAGIGSAVYYPAPMDVQPAITGRSEVRLEESGCPNAAEFCRRSLAIPVHADLSEAQIEYVLETLTG